MTILSTPLRFLAIVPAELSLAHVLRCGQSFRWQKGPARVTLPDDASACPSAATDESEWHMGWNDRTVVLRQDGTYDTRVS
jgi:N-glycosylase/DNA lyase